MSFNLKCIPKDDQKGKGINDYSLTFQGTPEEWSTFIKGFAVQIVETEQSPEDHKVGQLYVPPFFKQMVMSFPVGDMVIDLSPKEAEYFLSFNKSDKPVPLSKARKFVGKIMAGEWRSEGPPIVIEIVNGEINLIDGKLRLLAIIQSDATLKVTIRTTKV